MEPDEEPSPSKRERTKLARAEVLLVVLAVLGIGITVWLAWLRPAQKSAGIDSFNECVAAGYPVQESFPEVCITPDGQRFTKPAE